MAECQGCDCGGKGMCAGVSAVLVPTLVVIAGPWVLLRAAGEPLQIASGWPMWMGGWLVFNGLALAGWSARLVSRAELMVCGPYRHVRNPMLLGLFLILLGETVLFRSWVLWVYTLVIVTAAHLMVLRWEEPNLAKRFGSVYDTYRQRVPRWIPAINPQPVTK